MDRYSLNAMRAEELYSSGLKECRRDLLYGITTSVLSLPSLLPCVDLLSKMSELIDKGFYSNLDYLQISCLTVASLSIALTGFLIAGRGINGMSQWQNLERKCRNRR